MIKNIKPFTESPTTKDHIDPNWKDHNEHLIDNLSTHDPIESLKGSRNITSDVHSVGYEDPKRAFDFTVVKPALHEELNQFLKDFPEMGHFKSPNFTTAHRESTYNKLANDIFGLGQYSPETTTFVHPGTNIPYSAQKFIHGSNLTDFRDADKYIPHNDIHKLAFMNKIMGNNDRHLSNLLIDKTTKRPYLIDNALSFDYHNHFANEVPFYSITSLNSKTPNDVHNWIQNLDLDKGAEILKNKGAPDLAIKYFKQRGEEAKRWSKLVQEKMGSAKHLGSGLAVVHGTRAKKSNEIFFNPKGDQMKVYSDIVRGNPNAGYNEEQFNNTKVQK